MIAIFSNLRPLFAKSKAIAQLLIFALAFTSAISASATSVAAERFEEILEIDGSLNPNIVISNLKLAALTSGITYMGKQEFTQKGQASFARYFFQFTTLVAERPLKMMFLGELYLSDRKIKFLRLKMTDDFASIYSLETKQIKEAKFKELLNNYKNHQMIISKQGSLCFNGLMPDLTKISKRFFSVVTLDNFVENTEQQSIRYELIVANKNKEYAYQLYIVAYHIMGSGSLCIEEPRILGIQSQTNESFQAVVKAESEILNTILNFKKSLSPSARH